MTASWLLGLGLGLVLAACGDDAPAGSAELGDGCTTDSQCKGDRICVDRECVDPEDRGGERDAGERDAGGSGTGGRGGTGSTAGTRAMPPPIDDPELEEACSFNCEARHAAACSMNIGSLDQCLAQCLIIDEQNWGYCHEEQADQFACLASGGYSCLNGYPAPKSTCLQENQALGTCGQMAPCRQYCARRASECGDDDSACVEQCRMDQGGFEDAICGHYYTQLISCLGQHLTCDEAGQPVAEACKPAVAEVADCVGRRNHVCDGFCWAAEQIGCGSDSCVDDCKAKTDETRCGHYQRSAVDCAFQSRELRLTCEDGEPVIGSACESQLTQVEMCLAMQ